MPWAMQIRPSVQRWTMNSDKPMLTLTQHTEHHVDHSTTSSIWQNQWELYSSMPNERFLSWTQAILWKLKIPKPFSSVQFSHLVMSDSATPWITARQDSLSITNSQSSLKTMCIESVIPSSHLILYQPLLLLSSMPPRIRVFPNESILHMRWPKYWSFRFSINPSNENPGLISFRMDWLDLLEVQGTLKRLLQHHSLKASILWHSTFFTVQLSHPYMTTGKTIALTRRTFVG